MSTAEQDEIIEDFIEICRDIGGEVERMPGGFGRSVRCDLDAGDEISHIMLRTYSDKNPRIDATTTRLAKIRLRDATNIKEKLGTRMQLHTKDDIYLTVRDSGEVIVGRP